MSTKINSNQNVTETEERTSYSNQKRSSKREGSSDANKAFKNKPFQLPKRAEVILKPSYAGKIGQMVDVFQGNSACTCMHLMVDACVPEEAAKWSEVMTYLYNNITAKYTGPTGFTVADVEHYVLSVRALRCILLDVYKAYTAFHTYAAFNTFFEDFMKINSGLSTTMMELYDLYEQYRTKIENTFPLNLPILKSDIDMFGYYYKDEQDDTASFYDIYPVVHYYDETSSSVTSATLRSSSNKYGYVTTLGSINTIIQALWSNLCSYAPYAKIASAITATYTSERNTKLPVLQFGQAARITFDKVIAETIDNGVVRPLGSGIFSVSATSGLLEWTRFTPNAPGVTTVSGNAGELARVEAVDNCFNDVALNNLSSDANTILQSIRLTKSVLISPRDSSSATIVYKGVGMYNLSTVILEYNGDSQTPNIAVIQSMDSIVAAYRSDTQSFSTSMQTPALLTDFKYFPRTIIEAVIYSNATAVTAFHLIDVLWDVKDFTILKESLVADYANYLTEALMTVDILTRKFNIIPVPKAY